MQGKKSFVLYCDLISTINLLPDEQAGKLLKHILKYVNDEDPISDDMLVNIAFEPIKQQLKRDLDKWSGIRQKRSDAGKQGGRPQKQNKANQANAIFEKQSKAKKAVNVNDNVNVNVNVNDNVNEIKKKKEEIFYPFESEKFFKMWEMWKGYKQDQHKFTYKSNLSEQAALKKLGELAAGSEIAAISIIEESIAQGYKGLFELKNYNNGKKQSIAGAISDSFANTDQFKQL